MSSRYLHLNLGSIAHAVRGLQRDGTAFASVVDTAETRAASLTHFSTASIFGSIEGSVSPGIVDRTGTLVRKARKCKGLADVEDFFPVNLISQERVFGSICGHTIGRSQRLGDSVLMSVHKTYK
jgi:hypothetical protein